MAKNLWTPNHHPSVVLPQRLTHTVQLSRRCLYAVAVTVHSGGTKEPSRVMPVRTNWALWRHDFAKVGVEDLACPAQSPDLNPVGQRPPPQTSVPDLTSALMGEWALSRPLNTYPSLTRCRVGDSITPLSPAKQHNQLLRKTATQFIFSHIRILHTS